VMTQAINGSSKSLASIVDEFVEAHKGACSKRQVQRQVSLLKIEKIKTEAKVASTPDSR
jgi:hypothetical protein